MDRFLTIGMIIGETQRPFTLKLIPTTVEDALNDTVIDYSGSGDLYLKQHLQLQVRMILITQDYVRMTLVSLLEVGA